MSTANDQFRGRLSDQGPTYSGDPDGVIVATKILTQHPQGKKGVNIDKAKYDLIRSQIAACLEGGEELTYTEITEAVGTAVDGRFEGSINWYTEVVKLDLEARRVIERLAGSRPQRYRLVEA